jgi:penicillin-binding protein 1A
MELFSWEGFYTDSITVLDSIAQSLQLLQAGLIGLNPTNGDVMAWVGGIDFRTQPYDQVLAQRQMASSFKPIIYAAALEEGLQPCDYLDNDPIILSDHDDWSPENYDHSTGGKYSMTGALSKSMNIPTVNLYFITGYEAIDYLWKKMGFSAPLRNSPATSLGTNEASLLESAVAYAAFANNGKRVDPRLILSIESPNGDIIYKASTKGSAERILSESTCEVINAILQKAINEGTGVAMRSTYGVTLPLAGKTGTSQNYSDAWFIAYNPKIVLATRVGASTPLIHFNSGSYGSGSRLALPIAGITLQKSQKNNTLKKEINAPFPMLSPELISAMDCPDYREENYLENLFDQLRKESTTEKKKVKKGKKKKKKKKGFFDRIFN